MPGDINSRRAYTQNLMQQYGLDPSSVDMQKIDAILNGTGIWQEKITDYLGSLVDPVRKRYNELTDFNSALYGEYEKYLEGFLPNITPNQLLASPMAAGYSSGTSQKLAVERSQQLNTQRGEQVNRGVQEFALGAQGQANQVLNTMVQQSQFLASLREQQRQFNIDQENQPGFGESLLNIGANIGGFVLGNTIAPGIGGFIGSGLANAATSPRGNAATSPNSPRGTSGLNKPQPSYGGGNYGGGDNYWRYK